MDGNKVQNKWTNRVYEIISRTDNSVTMKRENGSVFTINRKEFEFSYHEMKKKLKN